MCDSSQNLDSMQRHPSCFSGFVPSELSVLATACEEVEKASWRAGRSRMEHVGFIGLGEPGWV